MPAKPIFHLFLLMVLAAEARAQTLTHRWSFNQPGTSTHGTMIVDSVAGAQGFIRGNGATLTGTALMLPGTSNGNGPVSAMSAYFDLPNGIISAKTDLTVEIWATIHSAKSYQRLFDFGQMNTGGTGEVLGTEGTGPSGSSSRDGFLLTVSRDSLLDRQRLESQLDGTAAHINDTSVTLAAGTQYHFVVTYQAGAGSFSATGGRMIWYRNGTQISSLDIPYRLAALQDVNNWLGRSQWSNDSNAHISYDEVRLFTGAMTAAAVSASQSGGPNAAAPVAQPDSATLLRGQKVLVPVLANDTGGAFPTGIEIVTQPAAGIATIKGGGKILYANTDPAAASDSFTYRVAGSSGFSNTTTVSISFSNSLRIPNTTLNVPANTPPTAINLVDAFPGVTFANPVCLATPPGETGRLFVCQKGGIIRVIPDVTATSPTASTFLTLNNVDTGSECGLLGLAFHPNYAVNRLFFVFYSVTISGQRYERVSRFAASAGNPNVADPAETVLIEQFDIANNHNGGDMHFGPDDGYLYISLGDEGNQDDSNNNSQRIDKDFFSGILRIDVDKKAGNLEPSAHPNPGDSQPEDDAVILHETPLGSGVFKAAYSIPLDNPWVHTGQGGSWNGTFNGTPISGANLPYVRSEFWAVGMRNPWRMSFDPVTKELWVGDVGGGQREEVNLVTKGKNYGWAFREGFTTGPKSGAAPANFATLYGTDPLYDYTRGSGTLQGFSVTGGLVYRGTKVPSLTGKYIFSDYVSGNIWSLQRNGAAAPTVTRILGEGGIAAFGKDPSNQDLLLADENSGLIRWLSTTSETSGYPVNLTATGLFADLADLSPAPGLTNYSVNLPFWSDHAEKRRWMIVPNGVSDFTWSRDGLWTLPAGTIWVKHFDMRMERQNPASLKRIETRLIVKNASGAYGVSYRWNEAGTEATLAADGGEDFPLAITDNGAPVPQTWRIPSRADCMTCHTPQAGHALSFNTRQLNFDDGNMLGFTGNQLATFQEQGFFTNDPGSPNLLPRHVRPGETEFSKEAHARSYLAVNCAYCHKSGGTGLGNFDVRPELTLSQTGLVNGLATNSGPDPLNRLIVPGDSPHSIVLQRVGATNGFTRMPPIGSNVIDTGAVALLTDWINGELDDRMTYAEWRTLEFGADPNGESNLDPDGDGMTNAAEFLAGTLPKSGASALRPQTTITGGNVKLGFNLPVNRSFKIATSTNLQTWSPWDIPGNQGLPVKGGLVEITRPMDHSQRFFRVEVSEN